MPQMMIQTGIIGSKIAMIRIQIETLASMSGLMESMTIVMIQSMKISLA